MRHADDVVIKAAYKALAQKYHPDKHKTKTEAFTAIMADLNEAFAALGTKAKRKEYDAKLMAALKKSTKVHKQTAATPEKSEASIAKAALIDQLIKNTIDEMLVLDLFEKTFQCKLKINNGWMTSYSFKSKDGNVTHDYVTLKKKIIDHLQAQAE